MTATSPQDNETQAAARSNRRVAFSVAGGALFMLGMSFAAVPLYDLFCRVTGFGGTPMIADSAPALRGERTMRVSFDANVGPGLNWSFEPEVGSVRVLTGETKTVFYRVTNRSNQPQTGMATFNVTPDQFGGFFNKIQCFCFTEQTLGPGESMDMPVVFFLDPALEKNETLKRMHSVTLSYTFIAVKNPRPVAAAASESKPRL
jgi:cytochrome c oxidase assembly protein subunit 11